MLSTQNAKRISQDGKLSSRIRPTISLPVFQVVSEREKGNTSNGVRGNLITKGKQKQKIKLSGKMQETTSVQIHTNPDKERHQSCRKGKSHSGRHNHKCHKTRVKSTDSLTGKSNRTPSRNHLSNNNTNTNNNNVNLSALSMDPGLSQTETLSPFEVNVNLAYEHVRKENAELRVEMGILMKENKELRQESSKLVEENSSLKGDISLMKNLVYKLNVELEKCQRGEGKISDGDDIGERLPRNYDKNFLKPILPLLKAYCETIKEKDDMIKSLESEYKKFNSAFNSLLDENEKLYEELEKKFTSGDGGVHNEVRVLKKDLEMAKQENNLLFQQIKLEREKLVKVHSVFKVKVEEVSREKEDMNNDMEECKADLYVLKGKYAVLKQEFERLKMENDSRVPMAVHSASINECRKLFQDLKNEYENEKQRLTLKIKEHEGIIQRQNKDGVAWTEEKNFLERSNFNQTFEIESLRKKISELENQLAEGGKMLTNDRDRRELIESKRELRESNKRVEELSNKLSTTKKQLQKAMIFAEDIVRKQESLLLQLHEKQRENNYMTTQFGSLKSQIKDVERDAQKDLNSIEERINRLENENHALTLLNSKLEKGLAEKEEIIKKLEPTKESKL